MGLYSLFYAGKIAATLGFVGLPLVLIHGAPGFHVAHQLGWVSPSGVIHGFRDHAIIESINGVVWALTYGLLGVFADRMARSQSRPEAK